MTPFTLALIAAPLVLLIRAAFVVWPERLHVPHRWRSDLEGARPVVLGALGASAVAGSGCVDLLALVLVVAAVVAARWWSMTPVVVAGCVLIAAAPTIGV
jgi:hypothetical protein